MLFAVIFSKVKRKIINCLFISNLLSRIFLLGGDFTSYVFIGFNFLYNNLIVFILDIMEQEYVSYESVKNLQNHILYYRENQYMEKNLMMKVLVENLPFQVY